MARTFPGGLADVNAEAFAANLSTIPTGRGIRIDENSQSIVYVSLTIDGSLTVLGELRVVNWPS